MFTKFRRYLADVIAPKSQAPTGTLQPAEHPAGQLEDASEVTADGDEVSIPADPPRADGSADARGRVVSELEPLDASTTAEINGATSPQDLRPDAPTRRVYQTGPFSISGRRAATSAEVEGHVSPPNTVQDQSNADNGTGASAPARRVYQTGPFTSSGRLAARIAEAKARAAKSAGTSDADRKQEQMKKAVILQIMGGVIKFAADRDARQADLVMIRAAVAKKQTALQRQMRKSLVLDPYGNVSQDGRLQEASRFLSSMRLPLRVTKPAAASAIVLEETRRLEQEDLKAEFNPRGYPANGHDFEIWLATSLERFGWTALVTRGSGDQGVDVVAVKEELTIAIQAKRYQSKVGNAAVQEVYSGAAHLGIANAAVITTVGFTTSAIELASSTNVKLLEIDDIPFLDKIFTRT